MDLHRTRNDLLQLSKEELVAMIDIKELEIENIQAELKKAIEKRDEYYEYNKFHMQEITRLDKIIGQYKKNN